MAEASETTALKRPAGLAHEWAFLGAGMILFIAGAAGTVYWCGSACCCAGTRMPGGWTLSMAWTKMPGQTWLAASASFIGMWILMMIPMMLPALMPMLLNYRRCLRAESDSRLAWLTAVAAAGYFSVWSVIGIVVYPFGVALAAAEMRWPSLARCVPIATGIILFVVVRIQFTAWKARQLECCRNAPDCNRSLSTSVRSAWTHGLRLGVRCSLCCSGFMVVLLVSGVMDLGVMCFLTAAITFERLSPRPDRAARIAGIVVAGTFAVALISGAG